MMTPTPLVYGMGVDLALILSVMGTVFSGNPISLNPGFSIGGASDKGNNLLNNLGGLLGESIFNPDWIIY